MKAYFNKYIKLIITMLIFSNFLSCSSNKYPPTIEKGNNNRSKNKYYKVKPGDTLYQIGLRYNLNVNTLKKINHINNEDKIVVGQIIKINTNNNVYTAQKQEQKDTNNQNRNNKITATNNQINAKNQINLSKIKFIWPVKGNILNYFNGKTNKGIDIQSKKGTIVNAAADGKIVHADYVKGYGKSIIISHDPENKILTVYGHLSNVLIHKGAKVKANEKIALVGSDDAPSARLHFEIRNNTIALNPLNYLPK